MEERVKELQEKKNTIEKNFDEETRALEKKKKSLQQENTRVVSLVKEKEKEIRLNNLRLKELRKLAKFGAQRGTGNFNKLFKNNIFFRERRQFYDGQSCKCR